MPSDLATAMITGQNAGLMADPALAAIAPQLQMAQALSTQGMSTAPAYPAQAIGRLGQALAGAYMTHDAQSQLSGLSTGSVEGLQKIFPAGTPLGDGLRSDSPYVRMMSMNQASKAMLLNSESKKVGPTDTIVAPATARQGGGVVAAGLPALAGAVEGAKNAPLIARAGGTAAAELPYKPVERVVQGPQGPEKTNVPAVELGGQPGGPMMPKPVQTVPVTAPPGGAPAAPGAPRGTPVETPEFKGNVALHTKADEAIGGIIGQAIEGGGRATYDKLHALDTMESALRQGGNHIVTGPLAEHALKAKQLLNSVGLDAGDLTKGLPETEIISKMNAQLASASAKAMTGRPTQNEFNIWMRNNPGIMTSKPGTLALIDVLRQQSKQDIDVAKLGMDKKNWDNWPTVIEKYYQDHSLINPLTGKSMRDEIAAAHAAPGGGGAAAGPAPAAPAAGGANAGSARLGPAVGTVFNGHKFLGGENIQSNWQLLKGDRQ